MCRWAPSGESVPLRLRFSRLPVIVLLFCWPASRSWASGIHGHHHHLVLFHPLLARLGFCDGWVWGKVSPARNTGSSSCYTAGQSAGSKGRICSGEATSARAGALSIILAGPMKPPS